MKTQTVKRKNNHKKKNEEQDVSEEELEDISVVGNSLSVSVKGVRELIRAVSEGTQEFQDVMRNECSLIYECKVCQNLFRSVANFISHKRQYCKRKFQSFSNGFHNNEPGIRIVEEKSELVNGCDTEVNKDKRKNFQVPSLECLPLKELSSPQSAAVTYQLENTSQTSSAVFQTVQNKGASSIRKELRELEQCASPEATILEDGTTFVAGSNGLYKCKVCRTEFPTSRAMERHVNVYHQARMCYPCPLCKVYFVSPWCVYRHLNKVHNRKEDQIRRLRQAVLAKAVRRELYQPPRVISDALIASATNASKRAEDEKWIAQFEGDLICKICNKSFTRRAALNVHSVMCKPQVKPIKSADKESKQSAPLRCAKCQKQFGRRAVLSSHEVKCNGTPPRPARIFNCKFCGKSFPRRRPLTEHIAVCLRATPRSPLRHLLTPPKLSAAPKLHLSSPMQVKCDYKMMPPLFAPHGKIATRQVISSKLEAVVQKLHDNPSKVNEQIRRTQYTTSSSASTKNVLNVNSRIILAPSVPPGSFKVSLTGNNRGIPPNGNLFISVPSNGTVSSPGTNKMPLIASLIPVINIDSVPISPNSKFGFVTNDSHHLIPDLVKVHPSSITLDNSSKIYSPLPNGAIVNKIVNNTVMMSTNSFSNQSYCNKSQSKIEVITVPDSSSQHLKNVTALPVKDSLSISSNHSFIEPSTSALSPTSNPADSEVEFNRDSLYSTPINFSEENHQETDLDVVSGGTEDSNDSTDTVASLLPDDSGVSDDGCLPENLHLEKCSPFKGFDPPTVQELLPAKRLSSLVSQLDL